MVHEMNFGRVLALLSRTGKKTPRTGNRWWRQEVVSSISSKSENLGQLFKL